MRPTATTEPTGPSRNVTAEDPGTERLIYRDRISPADTAIPVIAGKAVDFFTFSVYAIASVVVFPELFFPGDDPVTSITLSFLVFSLAFLFRPLGTALFNMLGKRSGRAVRFTVAGFLLGGSTMAIAFIPPYSQVGILAPLLLIITRIGQGLGLGGNGDGSVLLLALNAPKRKRSWYGMLPQLGASIGFALALVLFIAMSRNLSSADFLNWGWRFPFFIVLVLNIVAIWTRLRLLSTPDLNNLENRGELTAHPLPELVSAHGRDIVLAVALLLSGFALFHMVSIFPLSWGIITQLMPPMTIFILQLAGVAICIGTTLLSGWLADIYGRKPVLTVAAALTAVFSLTAPDLLSASTTGWAIYIFAGFAILGLSFGQTASIAASFFSPKFHLSGGALVADLGWLTGAAFAPLLAFLLAVNFGASYAGYYLLSGALVTLMAAVFWTPRDLATPGYHENDEKRESPGRH